MARPNVFSTDTYLYNIATGERRLFPMGETDPGDAWSEKPGGDPVGSATTTQSLRDLIAAQEQIETLQAALDRNHHDLAQAEKARADAEAKVEGLEQAVSEAERLRGEAEATAAQVTAERDQAVQALSDAQARAAAAEEAAQAANEGKAAAEATNSDLLAAQQTLRDELAAALAAAKPAKGKKADDAADTQPAPAGDDTQPG